MTEHTQQAVGGAETARPPLPPAGAGRSRLARERVALARRVHREQGAAQAADVVEESLRAGLWRYSGLWSELWALMEQPTDYQRVRSLWWDTPRGYHQSVPIIRAVARAASIAGEHDDARVLLRKAILLQDRQARGLRRRLGRVRRRVRAALPQAEAATGFEGRARVALDDLAGALDELPAFLISGTLLGLVRESRFLSWDKDIDLGVLAADAPPGGLAPVLEGARKLHIRRVDFTSGRLRVVHANGTMIDLFPHYPDASGRIWHDGSATRWWNTPFDLKPVDFLGAKHLVPGDPERYLAENYGDWRTPAPDFDARLDAPNVEVTDPDFLDTLLFFSLLDAVAAHHAFRRARYAGLLRERGERDWLDRI